MERRFFVNNTLSKIRLSRRKIALHPRRGGKLRVRFRLSRGAAVRVLIENAQGDVVRVLTRRRLGKGQAIVVWNGRVRKKAVARPGRYRVRVLANSTVGRSELFADVIVRKRARPTFEIEAPA